MNNNQSGLMQVAEMHPNALEDKASIKALALPNHSDTRPKKKKTRRGKSKRKHPYIKSPTRKRTPQNKMIKPDAPHNSNQFLLEDHGVIEDLDENLKYSDSATSTVTRTRDSSFSVDSDGEFYSSPDDEEQFLIRDFVDQYETVQAERLHSLTKMQLIEEYSQLQSKIELLSKRLSNDTSEAAKQPELQREIERLMIENERLRRENDLLRTTGKVSSDSEDSETDSTDSCSSTSSNSSDSSCSTRKSHECLLTNGHSNSVERPVV